MTPVERGDALPTVELAEFVDAVLDGGHIRVRRENGTYLSFVNGAPVRNPYPLPSKRGGRRYQKPQRLFAFAFADAETAVFYARATYTVIALGT